MRLRPLELKDAPFMLEWMHSENVTHDLATDFSKKSIQDCERFIQNSLNSQTDMHLAIVSDVDEYMGTVSLKHINREKKYAEFAITVRECAMGKGYSWFGMSEILRIAFEECGLNSVYWCVSRLNKRAVRFYDKHKFQELIDVPSEALVRYANQDLKWYSVLKDDDYKNELIAKESLLGCKLIKIKTIPTADAGELSFFEADKDIPFPIKRIYYITKVPEGVRRGFHAHKELKQLLFCPYGKIQIILDNGKEREEIVLSDPSVGIVIDRPLWREMLWLEPNSVLCVAASEYYCTEDYIRDYNEFLEFQKNK